ncbi:MAG: hypothetical protein OXF47_02365 [Nitrospira sp.]|nr:hypothetical protein [Nitrospira sp.]MCY4132110.1 hypothetical protein [Nitrospira sp.]
MAKKTVNYNQFGASKLPQDKPVVYRIKTNAGQTNYVGIAKRGRVQERIQEHLAAGNIPGAKVEIEQKPSIQDARKTEALAIARSKPKYNKQG